MNTNAAFLRVEQALRSIGYEDGLLKSGYEYADVTGLSCVVRTIELAGFAQSSTSYRNVCIGVISSNGISGVSNVARHWGLGAPMIFEIGASTVDRWKITKGGPPIRQHSISHHQIENEFLAHRGEWQPASIFKAKTMGADLEAAVEPRQLDFVDLGLLPALEGMIHKKLDRLLRSTIGRVKEVYEAYNHAEPNTDDLFRLVIRFIAAKVLRDREYPGKWDSDNAAEVLGGVEAYFGSTARERLPEPMLRQEILTVAWSSIGSSFYFQNLSADDLAFIYENTLVTSATRKVFGTHSTPPALAEYIVRKLPFENLPHDDRHVLEPCAGHAIFLVSAMRRLRELLPSQSSENCHNYFVDRLVGIEAHANAFEIGHVQMVLADLPNHDGWQLYREDVFATDRLEKELERADILLCNPPFEDFTLQERELYGSCIEYVQKPAELLRRILLNPPKLLGIVLPRVFNFGGAYREIQRELAESYGKIELVVMPEVFTYSKVPTVLLLAWDQQEQNTRVSVTCRSFTKQHWGAFLKEGREPPATHEIILVTPDCSSNISLWIPPLLKVWEYLGDLPKLETEVTIHQGIHWRGRPRGYERGEHRTDVISDVEKPGYKKGYARVQDCLTQYSINNPKYLSLRPEDQHDKAYLHDWASPKVVCNAARLHATPWRVGAVVDQEGKAFSKQFFALWPKGSISLYALAALLNSPVTNAYCYDRDQERDNRIKTLQSLPVPAHKYLVEGGRIDVLSQELHSRMQEVEPRPALEESLFTSPMRPSLESSPQYLEALLKQIDAEILRAYDLPPVLERRLLDTFQGIERPVPFEFKDFYPTGLTAYIPLHELISEEFQEARADRLLERLSPISDPTIHEMLDWLKEERDEGLPS